MSQGERFVYQVIATRSDRDDASELRLRLGYKPFLIGTDTAVDLRLDGEAILPIHARLFTTSKGQVMVTNLGLSGTVLLGDDPLPSFTAVHWKPGVTMHVGEYALELVTLVVGSKNEHFEQVRPSVITQEGDAVAEPPPDPVSGAKRVGGSADLVAWPDNDQDGVPALRSEVKADLLTDAPLQHDVPQAVPPEKAEAIQTPRMPFIVPQSAPPTSVSIHEPGDTVKDPIAGQTLPKDWHHAGQFGAQPMVNPVNLVAGERVRIPISIRNGYAHPLHLRVFVAGVPREWVIVPEDPVEIAPGEISALDLILQTPSPIQEKALEMKVRLTDRSISDATLTLPVQINFKDEPDLVGSLDPAEVKAPNSAFLRIQNHTQATMQVFVAGHSDMETLQPVPAQTQVGLPPGQVVKIPVDFQIMRRSLFRSAVYSFAVSAVQGSRAPLDFPGKVRVRPRLSLIPPLLLLFAISLIVLLMATYSAHQDTSPTVPSPDRLATGFTSEVIREAVTTVPPGTPARPTPFTVGPPASTTRNAQPVPTVTQPAPILAPTIETDATSIASPTQVPRPSATPSLAFQDPRSEACTVAIPPGWQPYTVRSRDTAFRLAIDHGTTVDELASVNCLQDPRQLREGQILLLPSP